MKRVKWEIKHWRKIKKKSTSMYQRWTILLYYFVIIIFCPNLYIQGNGGLMLFDFWGIWLDFPFNALYMILCTCTIISWYDVAGNPLQNSICRLSCHSWGDVSCNSKQYDAYAQFGQVAHIQKTHILYKVGLHSVEKYT